MNSPRYAGEGSYRIVVHYGLPFRKARFTLAKLLRRRAVGVFDQRRKVLRRILVLESVDKICGRKLAGRQAAVAQQIADGVVVIDRASDVGAI